MKFNPEFKGLIQKSGVLEIIRNRSLKFGYIQGHLWRHTELISWFYKGYKSVKVVTTPLQQLLQSCFVFASRLWRLSYQRWVGWEYNAFLHISIHRRRNFSVFELKQKEKAGQQTFHKKRSLQINWESKRLTWIFTL